MDHLGFDPHGASKHDSTYTTLSRIHTKEKKMFNSFQQKNNVDVMVNK
jgi:hypothetical protein